MLKDVKGNASFFHLVLALHEWLDHPIIVRASIHKERATHSIWLHNRPGNKCLPAGNQSRDISLLKPGLLLRLHANAVKAALSLCSPAFLQLSDTWFDALFWT